MVGVIDSTIQITLEISLLKDIIDEALNIIDGPVGDTFQGPDDVASWESRRIEGSFFENTIDKSFDIVDSSIGYAF